ncbi:MAG: peroxidase family protein [Polyangiales bacterium]
MEPDRNVDAREPSGARAVAATPSGCPRAGVLAASDALTAGLSPALRETHAATRRLLAGFTAADPGVRRQLHVQLTRLERALDEGEDPSGATHQLAGVCRFQLADYPAALRHLRAACTVRPGEGGWRALRDKAQAAVINRIAQRRPPVAPFRAETLRAPAALALRAPRDVQLPAPSTRLARLGDLARTVSGMVLGALVRVLMRVVGMLGAQRSWRLEERLATRVRGRSRTSPLRHLQGAIADLTLASLRERMNAETLQDPYLGDLAGHASPGQRRPDWTRFLPTADGSWRTDDPNMGRVGTRFPHQGLIDASEIAVNRALDPSLPSPRLVSRALLAPRGPREEVPFLNLLAAGWIQFQVHGWFNHRQLPMEAGSLRYPLDEDDPIRVATGQTHLELRKTQPDVLSGRGPVYFQNEVTHWWDASQIYGSDQATEDRLRTGPDGALLSDGKLYLGPDGTLPVDPELGVEDTGFNRNWWVGLSLFHVLFAREHNHVCDCLKSEHPRWSTDHLFKAARLEVAAKMARIHTVEWTPAVLPNRVIALGLNSNWSGFLSAKFRPFEKRRAAAWWTPKDAALGGMVGGHTDNHGRPRMFSENFSEVYRLHAAVPDVLCVRTELGETGERIPMEHAREGAAPALVRRLGMHALALTFGYQHMPALVGNNYPSFMLDTSTEGLAKIDLAATDIVRARERGVPSYNQFRAQLGRSRCRDYEDITADSEKAARLRAVYGPGNIEKVDLQVGMLFEDGVQRPFQGFDDTRFAVFLQEASRRLEADPFFTEKWNDPRVYSRAMRARIETTTLKRLLLRHLPELCTSGLAGVHNAFEPWGTTVHDAPDEHPLSATEEWYAHAPSADEE